ncbi:MAG: chitobiase/beta-hexosaminidase C-terminal domain-containing protein [Verrucomicrobia bacterium]|nr:chitobiase/beta-hexosaminidase C-terminal domain-containing protein [Verrucomicrobiota bacterium]
MRNLISFWLITFLVSTLGLRAQPTVNSFISENLFEPYDIVHDGENNFYISDSGNHRIVKYDSNQGGLINVAGYKGYAGLADAKGILARFSNPKGIVLTADADSIVVADTGNQVIRRVSLEPDSYGLVTTVAGVPGQAGYADGVGTNALFNHPTGLALDADGTVLIADSKNHLVRRLNIESNLVTTIDVFTNVLYEPNDIAVDAEGRVYVADTRNHTIRVLNTNGTTGVFAGSSTGESGTNDWYFADEGLLNSPRGLLYAENLGLMVADTGNHTLRRVFFNPEVGTYSLETYAGVPEQRGLVNGAAAQARFDSPVGMAMSPYGALLVVDTLNHAVRQLQITPIQGPVPTPQIGYVVFEKDDFGDLVTTLVPVTNAVFNNNVVIAIKDVEGVETYYTITNSYDQNLPNPTPDNGVSPPPYEDGLKELPSTLSMLSTTNTIKVRSFQGGRPPSDVVAAQFRFQTANPAIIGENPMNVELQCATAGAQMWYTTDGTTPEKDGVNSLLYTGTPIMLPLENSTNVLSVRAYKDGYKESKVQSKTFYISEAEFNKMSFGFQSGEASSDFIGAVGQRFLAPVTLTLLPDQEIYSLQFGMTATNYNGAPSIDGGLLSFNSMLMKEVDDVLITIPPGMYYDPLGLTFTNLLSTNVSRNLLMAGWLERYGFTNLFDTTEQDLVTYSRAHDTLFESKDGKVIVGAFSFRIPAVAQTGDVYEIEITRPSATSDGISQDVYIHAPTNSGFGKGALNSIKHIEVGTPSYIAGDVAPFKWFNAGDFGDGYLKNNDVLQVFQSAAYNSHTPPPGSDLFDAMDSSDGSFNASDGGDYAIDNSTTGDGVLRVDDVFVVFRRSLDESLKWAVRYRDENGALQAVMTNANVFPGLPNLPAREDMTGVMGISADAKPFAQFTAADRTVEPGTTIGVPITVNLHGDYPLKVLLLNIDVTPLDGAPRIENPIRLIPGPGLGAPKFTHSVGAANYAAAWLDPGVDGIMGEANIATLLMDIPVHAPEDSVYRIELTHVSGSPNGLAVFPKSVNNGLVTFSNRDESSWNDGIPDSWRLRYFGSVSNVASVSYLDPDGDGESNYNEFIAGTDPADTGSVFKLRVHRRDDAGGTGARAMLEWITAPGRDYLIEASSGTLTGEWETVASPVTGDGGPAAIPLPDAGARNGFFRVRISPNIDNK